MARPSRRLKVRIFIYGQGLIRGIFNGGRGGSTIKFDFQKGGGSYIIFYFKNCLFFVTFHPIWGKSSNKGGCSCDPTLWIRQFYQFMYSMENGLITLLFNLEQLTNKWWQFVEVSTSVAFNFQMDSLNSYQEFLLYENTKGLLNKEMLKDLSKCPWKIVFLPRNQRSRNHWIRSDDIAPNDTF